MNIDTYLEVRRAEEIALARKHFKKIAADPDSQGDILRSLDPQCGKKTILAALTLNGHPASLELLERLKGLSVYKDPKIREIAFNQVADTLRKRGTAFYIDCLKHPKFREKMVAVHSIWRFSDESAAEAITKRLDQIIRTRLGGKCHYHNGETELTHCVEFLHPYRERKKVQKTFQKLIERWSMLDKMEVWWITDQLEYFARPELLFKGGHRLPGIVKVVDVGHPIFEVVAKRDVKSAKRLFEEGISVYSTARYSGAHLWYLNSSPVEIAINNGDLRMLETLIQYGLNVERPIGNFNRFPLLDALEKKQNPIADYILNRGIDLNRLDEYGRHLFGRCCAIASPEQISRMIELGADVSYRDGCGKTPIHFAVSNESTAVMEILLTHGADVNAVCNYGTTALINSAIHGKLKSAEWLISRGADLMHCGTQGRDALSWAIGTGEQEVAELLRSHLTRQ